ncbi:SDR family NAD(P)-dependent oxidoreductase [Sabulibacter ruber]|uniref:SDR family NAD(P)-dependent oxidoreductase n=1 Tax=Sabulibacter ruber TaxID=2811901 RepID=UPI001A958CF2|nr:SDR family NAD(P)-dependent oxidoreductase [Sabulibacter ruber]
MKTVLITGANKGIGFESARQLLQKGFLVFLGSRNLSNGLKAAEQLKAEGLTNVEAVQIDVTSQDSVNAARMEIGSKVRTLDVLINNAGISGIDIDSEGHMVPQTAIDTDIAVYQKVYDTNVYGPARVIKAFIDLLKNSPEPRIVNLSSSQGSLTLHSDPNYIYYHVKGVVYLSSKAALNMYTVNLAYELRDTAFKVNAVSPGFTATDFTGKNGGSVEVAAKRIVKYALIGQDGPTGKLFCEETNPDGTGEIPW